MDRDTIYLDNDDEITSVVDKLKGSDFTAIDLVIPKEALVLKSVVNLKLLKKQADSLNKEIVIVTQDKVGKKLTEQIGIPVIEKPGQQPKEVRMTEGEDAAKIAAGAAAASMAAEEAIEFKKNAPESTAKEETDGIEFKEPANPIAPTAEVVTAEKAAEVAEPSDTIKPPKDKKKRRLTWKFWTILSVIGGLALFVVAYIFIPLAHIEVNLAAQKSKVDFDFTADKSYSSVDTGNQVVPAQVITIEQSKSNQYPATGKKDAGTKATGTVTIVNHNYSTSDFTINAGARVVTSGGLVYLTTTNVTVPKYTKPPQVDGQATVSVQATNPGESYNVNGGTMTIPGLNASASDIYATGGTFSGGTTKQISYVTQTDSNSAKDDLSKQLETDLVNAATQKAGNDAKLLDKAYKVEVESATASPDVNGEGANFTMTIKSKITAITFTNADLTKLATAVLGDQIGSGKEIVDSSSIASGADVSSVDFDKGTLKAKVSGEAFVATKIDQNAIKVQIAGEPNDTALGDVKKIDGVTDATITNQFPPFLKRIPRIKDHIYINVSLDKSGS